MPPIEYLSAFLIGFIASWIGSMVGGGGLLSIPFLVFLGLPPQVAVATNKFGSLGLKVGSIPKYWREGKIIWKYVLPFSIISFFGGVIGATALVEIDASILSSIIGVVLLAFLPLLFIRPKVADEGFSVSRKKERLGYLLYFFVAIWSAFFGGGAGVLKRYVMLFSFGSTMIESSATLMIPGLVTTVVAVSIFAWNNVIRYDIGLAVLVGMLLGGKVGAHTAIAKGERWVKIVFALVVLASAVKLLFF